MKRELVPGMLVSTGMLIGASVALPGQTVSTLPVSSGALGEERQNAADAADLAGVDLNRLHLNDLHLNWRYSSL